MKEFDTIFQVTKNFNFFNRNSAGDLFDSTLAS